VIRSKGINVVSPVDDKIGASYVHCREGEDQRDTADYMLSYFWGYTIDDIVDALVTFCESRKLDVKRTYVWICCLCVNQHRVVGEERRKRRAG